MHSPRTPFLSLAALSTLALAGCGSAYRPIVSSINPVGPAGQPQKYAIAISTTGPATPGEVSIIDFSGDTVLDTTVIGANPQYLVLEASGGQGYTLNGDGTLNTFPILTGLRPSDILQTTLFANSGPLAILPQGGSIYVAEGGRGSVAQLQGTPPAIRQELPTGLGTVYTVGVNGAPRIYAISPGVKGAPGKAAAIETTNNTISASIPVGINPVYGVMTFDSRRAFILNKGSNTLSVINAQTNALDTFTSKGVVTGTIPVGLSPVWADLVPAISELVVANAGDGTTPGSLTVVSIPFCPSTTLVTNPNCDPANPVDAVGFGQVTATIPVGVNPVMVAALADGTRAYVANAGNAALGIAGSISVVNLTTNTVTSTIPAGGSSDLLDTLVHGHPAYISVTTGTPTGKAYVTSLDSQDLTVIRTDNDTVKTHIPLQGIGVSVRTTLP